MKIVKNKGYHQAKPMIKVMFLFMSTRICLAFDAQIT